MDKRKFQNHVFSNSVFFEINTDLLKECKNRHGKLRSLLQKTSLHPYPLLYDGPIFSDLVGRVQDLGHAHNPTPLYGPTFAHLTSNIVRKSLQYVEKVHSKAIQLYLLSLCRRTVQGGVYVPELLIYLFTSQVTQSPKSSRFYKTFCQFKNSVKLINFPSTERVGEIFTVTNKDKKHSYGYRE